MVKDKYNIDTLIVSILLNYNMSAIMFPMLPNVAPSRKTSIIILIVGILICIIIVLLVFMTSNKCSKEEIKTSIVGMTDENKQNTLLCNFFIKSSYNSCATGNFMNGWVNLCALNRVIKYGCRVLDFEIYTVNDKCVVATSNSIKLTEKGSYNSIPIGDVLENIRNTAISRSINTEKCPNPSDPLFLHFRMKTNKEGIYNELARSITTHLGDVLISATYNINNYQDFCSTMKFSDLKNKVIILSSRREDFVIAIATLMTRTCSLHQFEIIKYKR
jgi:hypothetical protein